MPDDVGGGTVKVAKVTLTAAQIQTLGSAYITVVDAPGAGRTISVLSATAYLDYNSVAYTGGADLILTYGTAAIVTFDGILALTADSVAVASPAGTETSATFVNSTVQVTADDAPAAGDSPVSIYVVYTVIGL